MTGAVKAAIAAALALGAGVGIAIVASKSSSAATPGATPTPGVPPQGSTVWVRATTLQPGQTVRISLPAAALQQAAAQTTGITIDLPGFEALLASPLVAGALGATNFDAWGPATPGTASSSGGPVLPADWPADDTQASSEFHAQFVYAQNESVDTTKPKPFPPLPVASLPIQVIAWVPKGTGA